MHLSFLDIFSNHFTHMQSSNVFRYGWRESSPLLVQYSSWLTADWYVARTLYESTITTLQITLELIVKLNIDYFDWVFFRGHELSYASVVLSDSGSGLPFLGLFIVGGPIFPPHALAPDADDCDLIVGHLGYFCIKLLMR